MWNVSKGNCRGRKQSIDLEKENKPLAKCRKHRKSDRIVDLTDALTASILTEKGSDDHLLSAGERELPELSSDEMFDISGVTDEESQVMKVMEETATAMEKETLISHQNTLLKISNSSTTSNSLALGSKHDTAESSAVITDQSLALPKGYTMSDVTTKSQCFLDTLQEEMVDKVLGPGAPDERVTHGYEIVLQQQDFWSLNNCKWLNDQVC